MKRLYFMRNIILTHLSIGHAQPPMSGCFLDNQIGFCTEKDAVFTMTYSVKNTNRMV